MLLLWFSSGIPSVFFLTKVLIICQIFSRNDALTHQSIWLAGLQPPRRSLSALPAEVLFHASSYYQSRVWEAWVDLLTPSQACPFPLLKRTGVTAYFSHGMTFLKSTGSDILLPPHCGPCETPPYVLCQLNSRCQRMPRCLGKQYLGKDKQSYPTKTRQDDQKAMFSHLQEEGKPGMVLTIQMCPGK